MPQKHSLFVIIDDHEISMSVLTEPPSFFHRDRITIIDVILVVLEYNPAIISCIICCESREYHSVRGEKGVLE